MNYEYWVLDVKHRLLSSIEKAKRLLGYEPQMGFEDGLNRVYAWFVENLGIIERSSGGMNKHGKSSDFSSL